ncbi:MAG TPA: hypothetical protein VIV56_14120 [Gemmatimonadales bacterium]
MTAIGRELLLRSPMFGVALLLGGVIGLATDAAFGVASVALLLVFAGLMVFLEHLALMTRQRVGPTVWAAEVEPRPVGAHRPEAIEAMKVRTVELDQYRRMWELDMRHPDGVT